MARGPQPYIQSIVWKFIDRGLGKAKRMLDDYSDEADEATSATKQMNVQAAQNTAAMKGMSEATDEAAEEADELADSSGRVSRTIGRMKASSNGAVRALGHMAGKVRSLVASTKTWIALGVAGVIAAVGAAFAGATAKAAQFESRLNEARKTAGLSEREFTALRDGLLEIQSDLGVTQQDLADIAAEAGRLGIGGTDNIKRFTRTVALMSEATVVSAQDAAQGLAKITNAFGLPISRSRELASVLNELSNQTVANTADLIDAVTRVGQSGRNIGLTANEVAALNATLIDAGISARRAGTGLRTIFTRMVNNADKVAEAVGTSEEAIIQAYEENGLKAVKRYLRALGEMETAQRAAAIEDIVGVEQSQKVQALVNNMSNLETQISAVKEEAKNVDSILNEFQETTKDVAAEWDRIVQKLTAWVTGVGTGFTQPLEEVLGYINDWAGGVRELERDVTSAREQFEQATEQVRLASEFERARESGEGLEEVMQKIGKAFPEELVERGPDGTVISVMVDEMESFADRQQELSLQALRDDMTRAVRMLTSRFTKLKEAQKDAAKAQKQGDGEAYIQARKRVEDLREELGVLSETFVGQFADEDGEVDRGAIVSFLNDTSFTGTVEENLQRIIDLFHRLRESKEEAAKTDSPVDGSGDEALPEIGEAEASFSFDFSDAIEQVKSLQDAAEGVVSSDAFRGVSDVIEDYNAKIRDLRLELEGEEITQKQFEERATQAAQSYRKELIQVLDTLEEAGLLTEKMKKAVVKGLEEMGDQAEETEGKTQKIGETLQDVAGLVGGVTDVAGAFGEISESTEDALGGLSTMVDKVGRLVELKNEKGGFSELFSSPSGAISGVSTIVGALGGVAQLLQTDDNGRQISKLNRQIGEQVAALRRNTKALYEQSRIGSDLSSEELGRAERLLSRLPNLADDGFQRGVTIDQLEQTSDVFEGFGDLAQDLEERVVSSIDFISDPVGIPRIRGNILEALTGDVALDEAFSDYDYDSIDADILEDILGEDFQNFRDRLDRLRGQFGDFGDSVEGLIAEVRLRRDELGQSFSQLRDVIIDRLGNLGLSDELTSGLRSGLEDASREEVSKIVDGLRQVIVDDKDLEDVFPNAALEDLLPPEFADLEERLGDVTPSEFSDLLAQLDSITEGDGSGGSQSDRATRVRSQVTRTITEFQANELLSYQQGQLFELRGIKSILRSGLNVPDSIGSTSGGSSGTVYNVTIDTIEGDADAESVARKLEQELQQSNL